MKQKTKFNETVRSRRDFLKGSVVTLGASQLLSPLLSLPAVHAAGSDEIRVGLVGCGDRGSGAAAQAVTAAPNVKLVAMGDVFRDRLDKSRKLLTDAHGQKIDVPEERCFVGFDAIDKVLATDITYVILTTPPGFRAQHLKAAVGAGKHVFAEKPVAVDGPGVRLCLSVYEEAKAKNLCIAVGTQRHHQVGYLETMKRIHDGAIGSITSGRCYWNQGGAWEPKPRQPQWSDMEYQMRNWYYYTWLCGDHIVEQHVHCLDVINWAKGAHPVRALGMGGRQVRTAPEYGQIFDHFAVDYEYADGSHMMSFCRQMNGCDKEVSQSLAGTRGTCQVDKYSIKGETEWRFRGKDNDAYLQEHIDLIANIRGGKVVNELQGIAESTLTAIMGRMSAYTGKAVTWDQALNSTLDLMPSQLTWGKLPLPLVPVPGQTEFV
ncbi:MAG: Gfo/Idh/MocA family oxidoreductase [Terriglobia bacterium]